MRKLALFSALLGLLALDPALAQGTKKQREACERDSHKFCAEAEPDAIAVEKCLRANMSKLSPACRRQFKSRGRG
ncbi:MAG: hypothetical protein ACR650_10760 [Methylocystis sp.]|jgi:hypothetical protein